MEIERFFSSLSPVYSNVKLARWYKDWFVGAYWNELG